MAQFNSESEQADRRRDVDEPRHVVSQKGMSTVVGIPLRLPVKSRLLFLLHSYLWLVGDSTRQSSAGQAYRAHTLYQANIGALDCAHSVDIGEIVMPVSPHGHSC